MRKFYKETNDPLELLKVNNALRCEKMKLEYRKVSRPKDINPLDYTVMAALEKQVPKRVKGISVAYEGRVGNCPSCNTYVRQRESKPNVCECTQRLKWEDDDNA